MIGAKIQQSGILDFTLLIMKRSSIPIECRLLITVPVFGKVLGTELHVETDREKTWLNLPLDKQKASLGRKRKPEVFYCSK